MDVDAFLQTVSVSDMRLPVQVGDSTPGRAPETLDALFHLPLLALAVMVIARRAPFRTVYLGRNVALLLVEHFTALGRSSHGLGTSLTLRRRCADALAFLEAAGLAAISDDRQRIVTLTRPGKSHFDQAAHEATDLGLLVRQLRISQDRATARVGDEH
jgi:hypothetical protein